MDVTSEKEKKLVKVVGYPREVDINDPSWKQKIVQLGNHYYLRTSPDIVRVDVNYGDPNKTRASYRYFRKQSPLIVRDFEGTFVLKEHCLVTQSGRVVVKIHPDLVTTIDKKRELKGSCIRIKSIYYLTSDERLTRDALTGKLILREDAIVLGYKKEPGSKMHRNSGANYPYVSAQKPHIRQCYVDKKFYYDKDMMIIHVDKDEFVYRKNVSQIKDLEMVYAGIWEGSYKFVKSSESKANITTHPNLAVPVLESDIDKINNDLNLEYPHSSRISSTSKFITDQYPLDKEIPQNQPLFFRAQKGRHNGGEIMFKGKTPVDIGRSVRLKKTGRIGYTFGVEFETAAGEIPRASGEYLGLDTMSDGSLYHEQRNSGDYRDANFQGYEFVTKVLHGNKGVNRLEKMCDLLAKYTLLSNKCSTHIHVGGMNFGGSKSDMPKFNREFSARALALGAAVESELFALLPPSRTGNRYCQSIKRWGDKILPVKKKDKDKKNVEKPYEKELASFVFGEGAKFSSSANTRTRLGRWADGRYYWLNLINCNTDNGGHRSRSGGFQTIEFRAFPATHNFDDIYFYLLFSLAFVWFIENRPGHIIKRAVTLESMMLTACRGKKVRDFIKEYIRKHTK